jgi:regulator of protease activity HflC (stomatin/prohibitin superfamily)
MNFKRIAIGAALLLSVTACTDVPAGNVGIKVFLLGGDKGVDTEVLGVGRYWIGMNEELYIFPTFMQNYVWTKSVDEGSPTDESISFQTADGMTANADIGISYSLDPEKISVIFQTYRRGVDEITDTFLRNMVRDALVKQASNKPIEYVYGAGKAELIAAVQKDVAEQVNAIGIKIDKIYWIGEIRLPPVVLDSINNKNAATQMAQQRQNEVAQAKAEADKKIEDARGTAESILRVAEAQSKANKILAESLTTEFVQYEALQKWDGKLPTTMVPGQATPFISVK